MKKFDDSSTKYEKNVKYRLQNHFVSFKLTNELGYFTNHSTNRIFARIGG